MATRAIEIEVQDSGVGIAPEFLPYVFDRFRQADSRSIRRHGGLGLGLAIARHIVEQHRGEIRATSDGPGFGTTVHIRLPVGPDNVLRPAVLLSLPFEPDRDFSMNGMTILIVDDQADSCELLAALLERQGTRGRNCSGSRRISVERERASSSPSSSVQRFAVAPAPCRCAGLVRALARTRA